jgi:uncharacterized membrane protein
MSDLIIIGYADEQTAARAWDELTRLQRDYLIDLEDAAVIRRDRKGKLHLTTPAHHAVAWGTLSGLFWGFLIGLIFLFPLGPVAGAGLGVAGGLAGAGIGTATDLAIEDVFKQQVQDLVQPGTSAILIVLRKVTLDKFLEAMRPYGGTVLRTSLPNEAEQKVMMALHGPDRSAVSWDQSAASGPTAG